MGGLVALGSGVGVGLGSRVGFGVSVGLGVKSTGGALSKKSVSMSSILNRVSPSLSASAAQPLTSLESSSIIA